MRCEFTGCTATAVFDIAEKKVCEVHAKELGICLSCGQVDFFDNLIFNDTGVYCHACLNREPCVCGIPLSRANSVDTDDGARCVSCVTSEHYTPCTVCGTYTKQGSLCRTCIETHTVCGSCGVTTLKTSLVDLTLDGVHYSGCTRCTSIGECKTCKKQAVLGNLSYPMKVSRDRLRNTNTCQACFEKNPQISLGDYRHNRHIDSSDFLPNYKDKQLYFGIEIEQEIHPSRGDTTRRVDIGKLWWRYPSLICDIKRDGSLNSGQEIVTYPATFEYLMDVDWKYIFSIPKLNEDQGNNTGFHIHLSRTAFSTLHLYKFCNFLYRYSSMLELIGGRKLNSYCKKSGDHRWPKLKAKQFGMSRTATSERLKLIRKYGDIPKFDRYDIINATETTLELRSMAAPVTVDALRMRLQFVHAVYMFTKQLNIKCLNYSNQFLNYVELNAKLYPELAAYVNTHKQVIIAFNSVVESN